MTWVGTILTVLIVLSGVLMTFLILLQEGKGGGLAALGGTKAAGVEGVTNPIRRATAYLAGIFFFLLIALAVSNRPDSSIVKFPAATTTGATTGAKKEETKPAEGGLKVETPAPATVPATTPATVPATTPVTPEAPATDAPKTEAPKTDAPKTDAKAETPAAPVAPATPTAPAAPKTDEAKK